MMSTDARVGYLLPFVGAVLYKVGSPEWGIIIMLIVGNGVVTFFGPSFKLIFCFESFSKPQQYLMLAMNDILHGMLYALVILGISA
jgi:hypothetical protein